MNNNDNNEINIINTINKLQEGYSNRNIKILDEFVEELFTGTPDMTIFGTSTNEFFRGPEGIKTLLKDDWEGWGDLTLKIDSLKYKLIDNVAFFSVNGTVKYTFEHTKSRNERYLEYVKGIINDEKISKSQRISFVNWILTLNFHKHEGNPRDYYWPVSLCGIMENQKKSWKFSNLMFSISPPNYPDKRFQEDTEYREEYSNQLASIQDIVRSQNNKDLYDLLSFSFEFCTEEINNLCFLDSSGKTLNACNTNDVEIITETLQSIRIDETSLVCNDFDCVKWVTFFGQQEIKYDLNKSENKAIDEIRSIIKSSHDTENKLFKIHRSVSYQLKESLVGESHTYPIRGAAVVSTNKGNREISFLHIAYPFYWVMEGKLD